MSLATNPTPSPPARSQLIAPVENILKQRFNVPKSQVIELCKKFGIIEFGIFGSALRDDFRSSGDDPSDIDILIVFEPEHQATWKGWLALNEALKQLFQREVDVVEKRLLENPYRRTSILETTQIVYERK